MLANILDREVYTLQGSELSACIGAAKLGLLAVGVSSDQLHQGLPIKACYQPMPAVQPSLQVRCAKFRQLLPAAQVLRR